MQIILIHGLGRSPLSMRKLGRHLTQQGHTVHYFGYAAFCQSFEAITQRLIRKVRQIDHRPYVLIGHSLGNILARASLPHIADQLPAHFIMLAPPNTPSQLARRLRDNLLFRLLARDCGYKLGDATFYQTLPLPPVNTTIIAGTAGPRGRFSPFGQAVNDGVVSVEETKLTADCSVVLVPAWHTFIMHAKPVLAVIDRLLEQK